MNPTESPVGANGSEFVIELSGLLLFMKRFLQLGAVLALASGLYDSINQRSLWHLATAILNGGIYFALATYAIRTFPRKVSLEGDSVVFHKVPTTWFNIGPILVPLGITQRLVCPKASVALEWIGRSLALNDMSEGKSIHLASGKYADQLAAWFANAGITAPIGG
ncbi:hypothetical protein [Geothrix sp.]|jgi:hypothetical protein|uniref:hypothetical protein n=1 Tax=Geothrix sp. TaxID=1962974 RepID=UPI0025B91C4B|nr:hypothetical protein [Geothrix sp.]